MGLRWQMLALPLWVAACSGSSGSGGPDAPVFGEQCTPGGTFDLNGRAAVLASLKVHVDASGLVEVDTTAELMLAMDAVQSGTSVAVAAELCSIQIPDVPISGQDQPIRLEVSEATVASVGMVSGDGMLSDASATCATFSTDQFTIVIGARLNPLDSPLPEADASGNYTFCAPTVDTTCDLAIGVNCACDQEGDGKGGATLMASNVPAVDLDEVYATMRTNFSLSGEVHSSDLIIGTIDATIEQGILGCHLANGSVCSGDQVGAVKNLNPIITQQLGNPSKFRAVRVDPQLDCSQILMMRDELFPR